MYRTGRAYKHVDEAYRELVEYVLEYGTRKENRTGIDTISTFGYSYKLDVRPPEWPLLTTKKITAENIIAENLWFLSGEPTIQPLWDQDIHFWDDWANEDGELETAYGRYWRHFPLPNLYVGNGYFDDSFTTKETFWLNGHEPFAESSHKFVHKGPGGMLCFDQIRWILDGLKKNPNSRRYVLTAWHPANSTVSRLPACHCLSVWNVQDGRLNVHLTQRSGDIGLGIPYNIAGYTFLQRLFAADASLEVGEFSHTIVDAHIYENHIDPLKEQVDRKYRVMPWLEFDPKFDFFDYDMEDFAVKFYNPHPPVRMGVAV